MAKTEEKTSDAVSEERPANWKEDWRKWIDVKPPKEKKKDK